MGHPPWLQIQIRHSRLFRNEEQCETSAIWEGGADHL
jgi:hypothetical protein